MSHPDLFTAAEARDAALARVAENAGSEWMNDACAALRRFDGAQGTGEDFRVWLTELGITPHHHNAWGALVRTARSRGILHPTGEYRKMKTVKSHARETPVYRVA